jgi:hypothetical protein
MRCAVAAGLAINPSGVIDWGTNRWYLSGPDGSFRTNSVGFNGAGPTSATLSFVAPRVLRSVDAYNGANASSTVTLSCAGQTTVTTTVGSRQTVSIPSGWTAACASVTVGGSNGWGNQLVNFVVQ